MSGETGQMLDFTGFAFDCEIDVNRMGEMLGLGRRLSWEEPLILDPETAKPEGPGAFGRPLLYVYSFGSAVFVNCTPEQTAAFFRMKSPVVELLGSPRNPVLRERYALRVDPSSPLVVTNETVMVPAADPVYPGIVAFALAKSVGLERIEERLDQLLDRMEGLMKRLSTGSFALSDRELAGYAASILEFRYRSISDLMILEPPDITWDVEEADRLYRSLAALFEFPHRFGLIRQKTDTLLDITDVFTTLAHARRSARLEWIIIVLIAVEILLFLYELFR